MAIWEPQKNFSFLSNDHYLAFCTAKDWIQDTCEALSQHRKAEFSSDSSKNYLEFWGVLQAAFIQQDAINELHYALSDKPLPKSVYCEGTAWERLRSIRNLAVGHPNRQGKNARRCVSGRQPKSYNHITLTIYERGSISTLPLDLGTLWMNMICKVPK